MRVRACLVSYTGGPAPDAGLRRRFDNWLYRIGQIDFVVDGLNMAHIQSPLFRADRLQSFLSLTSAGGYQVVVILRRHVALGSHLPNVYIYYPPDKVSDDLFFIYTALRCGNRVHIVTNDKLRDHTTKMPARLHSRIRRWYAARIMRMVVRRDQVLLDRRIPYDMAVQATESTWHFPLHRAAHSSGSSDRDRDDNDGDGPDPSQKRPGTEDRAGRSKAELPSPDASAQEVEWLCCRAESRRP